MASRFLGGSSWSRVKSPALRNGLFFSEAFQVRSRQITWLRHPPAEPFFIAVGASRLTLAAAGPVDVAGREARIVGGELDVDRGELLRQRLDVVHRRRLGLRVIVEIGRGVIGLLGGGADDARAGFQMRQ